MQYTNDWTDILIDEDEYLEELRSILASAEDAGYTLE